MRKWMLLVFSMVSLPTICSAANEPPEFNVLTKVQSSDSSLKDRFESCISRNLINLGYVSIVDELPRTGFAFEFWVLVMADELEVGTPPDYIASWVGLQRALPLLMASNAFKPFEHLDEELPTIVETLESLSQSQTFYTNWSSGMGNGSDSDIDKDCETLVAGFDKRLLHPVRERLKDMAGGS